MPCLRESKGGMCRASEDSSRRGSEVEILGVSVTFEDPSTSRLLPPEVLHRQRILQLRRGTIHGQQVSFRRCIIICFLSLKYRGFSMPDGMENIVEYLLIPLFKLLLKTSQLGLKL
ncbi:hypothetical protein Salat_1728600 [Sesamum alatum]|uniref:Uncharacterized protein n=1 Tax=Sesamum alatum TaxID=300844 RepID=A0AAE2CKC4_9LAMI|nr:hypothetical protein Salat_1728600 [Sesamum alatum]